jgi:hypothetical protein
MALTSAQRGKIREIKEKYRKEGLKEIKGRDGVWRPTVIGESFKGEYLECVPDADNYHRNKYIFSDDNELKDSNGRLVGLDGRIALFGGVTLDDSMAWIPIGAQVGVIYCGERPNPGYKRATKLFTVMSDKELDVPMNISTPTKKKPAADLAIDDEAARELIKDCKTFLDSEGKKNPSILDIANYAEKIIQEDDKPDHQLLDQVHTILARDLIAECALSLTSDDNLNPSEEEVAECAKKILENKNRPLLTKVQLLLADIVKSKKKEV